MYRTSCPLSPLSCPNGDAYTSYWVEESTLFQSVCDIPASGHGRSKREDRRMQAAGNMGTDRAMQLITAPVAIFPTLI
jgi:hypothetical protein